MREPMVDPYAVLGVPRDADPRQVHAAYRGLAKRYHPDLHNDPATSARMRRVNAAWDVLSDPVRRARYDADHPRMAATWGASAWTTPAPARMHPRPRPEVGSSGGPPWAFFLVALVVGWLAIGGMLGGFPLPLILGLVLVTAVGSLLSRFD